MTRVKRLTETERAKILRETAEGVSTAELAARFGVTSRAIQYTRQREAERMRDAGVAQAAVTVKLTLDELAAFDEVLLPRECFDDWGASRSSSGDSAASGERSVPPA